MIIVDKCLYIFLKFVCLYRDSVHVNYLKCLLNTELQSPIQSCRSFLRW